LIQPQPNKYLESTVQTASPAQLLIMLCDGAIRFCKLTIDSMRLKNLEQANRNIGRVQEIISEFVITIDKESPFAEGLIRLYEYFSYQLIQANLKKDPELVEEVLNFLIELKGIWVEAAKLSQVVKVGAKHV
jgi:flagellar secretion chaperone FliS